MLLGRKALTNLDSGLESRDISFLTKVRLVKAVVFPVVMYGCESWTIEKAEHWRTVAFELWCWRRLLRVLWTERRSNQSILKEINPEYSLERLMLKWELQHSGHLMWSSDSLEKTLMLGKIEGRRRRGWQRIRRLDDITDSVDMSFSQTPGDFEGEGSLEYLRHGITKSQIEQSDWITTTEYKTDSYGTNCIAQSTLLDARWWSKWEGNSQKRRYTCTYSWFTLLYSRD